MKSTTLESRHAISGLAKPCKNFNFLAVVALDDPKDGREKLVLSNYVGGGNGSLIFIDVVTEEAEVVPLPGEKGAWALLPYRGEKMIVGTCSEHGYICNLDLKTRTWAEPVGHENNTYIWSIALGSDGMVYGGAYRSGTLLRYDPHRNAIESMGRPTAHPGNFYCREVRSEIPGVIVVTGGFATAYLCAYHIAEQKWTTILESPGTDKIIIREVTKDHICVEQKGELLCYDSSHFVPMEVSQELQTRLGEGAFVGTGQVQPRLIVPLKNGRLAGVDGQEYFIEDANGGRQYKRLPVEPPATHIRSLVLDGKGNIWGSCGFGQTIFRYSLEDGSMWNSLGVTKKMGEVYGMVFVDDILYMSCYAGGDHVVYDPNQPWSQRDNANPRTLKSVFPELQRPRANSVMGPDGGVWTGWAAKYGTYGGGLSRIDIATREVTSWLDVVPGQQVMGISADESHIYFTTNCGGEGLPMRDANEPGWLCVWHPSEGMAAKYPLAPGTAVGVVLAINGNVLVVEEEGLQVFDVHKREFKEKIELGETCYRLLNLGGNKVGAMCGKTLKIFSVGNNGVMETVNLPGKSCDAVVSPGKMLYFVVGAEIHQMQLNAD